LAQVARKVSGKVQKDLPPLIAKWIKERA